MKIDSLHKIGRVVILFLILLLLAQGASAAIGFRSHWEHSKAWDGAATQCGWVHMTESPWTAMNCNPAYTLNSVISFPSTNPIPRNGSSSVKIKVFGPDESVKRSQWGCLDSGLNSNVNCGHVAGEEVVFGESIYLSSTDWNGDATVLIMQGHGVGTICRSPNFALHINKNRVLSGAYSYGLYAGYCCNPTNDPTVACRAVDVAFSDNVLNYDTWYDLIVHVKLSNTGNGWIKFYKKTASEQSFTLIGSVTGISNLYTNAPYDSIDHTNGPLYRWDISGVNDMSISMDEFIIGKGLTGTAAFNEVAACYNALAVETYTSPNITSWGNNETNNNSLDISKEGTDSSTSILFNATSNQSGNSWVWEYRSGTSTYSVESANISSSGYVSNFSKTFPGTGTYNVRVHAYNNSETYASSYKTWNITITPPPAECSNSNLDISNPIIGFGVASLDNDSTCRVLLNHTTINRGSDSSITVGYYADNFNDGSTDWSNYVRGGGTFTPWVVSGGKLTPGDNATKSFTKHTTQSFGNVSVFLKIKETQQQLWSITVGGSNRNYDISGYSLERNESTNPNELHFMNYNASCSWCQFGSVSDSNRTVGTSYYYIFDIFNTHLNSYVAPTRFNRTYLTSTSGKNPTEYLTGDTIVLAGRNVSFDRIRLVNPNQNWGNVTSAFDAGTGNIVSNITINLTDPLTGDLSNTNYTVWGGQKDSNPLTWKNLGTFTTDTNINVSSDNIQIYQTVIKLQGSSTEFPAINRIEYESASAPAAPDDNVSDYISRWALNNNFNDSNITSNNYGTNDDVAFNTTDYKEGNASGEFDGNDDITFNNIPLTNLSYASWFKITPSGSKQDIFENMNTLIRINPASYAPFYPAITWFPNTSSTTTVSIPWANDPNWHHFVVTQAGTSCSLYLDGVKNSSITTCVPIRAGTSTGTIGSYDGYGNFITGKIDDVRVYDRELSQSEVSQISGLGLPDYIPPVPIYEYLTHYIGESVASWYNGTGNITNSYNVTWANSSASGVSNQTANQITVLTQPHQNVNISIKSFNTSGNGTRNDTALWINGTVTNQPVSIILTGGDYNYSEGQTFYIDADYSDVDNDVPTFSKTCSLGTLNTTTGNMTVSTTDGDQGSYSCQMNVTDGYNVASQDFVINIANSTPGIPINLTGYTVNYENSLTLDWVWEDGGNSDYYHIIMNGSDLGLFAGDNLSYSNTTSGHQVQTFNISAYSSELSVYSDWSNITTTTDNYAPYFDTIDNVTVNESEWVNISMLNTTDANGDTWTFGTNATSGTLSGYNFTWLTTYSDAGSYYWYFNVTDDFDGSSSGQLVYVTVNDVTITPEIISWGNNFTNNQNLSISVNVGQSIRFNATANQNITNWNWSKTS